MDISACFFRYFEEHDGTITLLEEKKNSVVRIGPGNLSVWHLSKRCNQNISCRFDVAAKSGPAFCRKLFLLKPQIKHRYSEHQCCWRWEEIQFKITTFTSPPHQVNSRRRRCWRRTWSSWRLASPTSISITRNLLSSLFFSLWLYSISTVNCEQPTEHWKIWFIICGKHMRATLTMFLKGSIFHHKIAINLVNRSGGDLVSPIFEKLSMVIFIQIICRNIEDVQ